MESPARKEGLVRRDTQKPFSTGPRLWGCHGSLWTGTAMSQHIILDKHSIHSVWIAQHNYLRVVCYLICNRPVSWHKSYTENSSTVSKHVQAESDVPFRSTDCSFDLRLTCATRLSFTVTTHRPSHCVFSMHCPHISFCVVLQAPFVTQRKLMFNRLLSHKQFCESLSKKFLENVRRWTVNRLFSLTHSDACARRVLTRYCSLMCTVLLSHLLHNN